MSSTYLHMFIYKLVHFVLELEKNHLLHTHLMITYKTNIYISLIILYAHAYSKHASRSSKQGQGHMYNIEPVVCQE